jgi:DNA-binding NarL/FixJ family response regulator
MSKLPPITVVIADDHALSRAGLRQLLTASARFRIVGESADRSQILDLLGTLQPDVLLLTDRLLGLQGLADIAALRTRSPRTKIILLTDRDNEAVTTEALQEGAHGVVSKQRLSSTLLNAMQAVHAGELWAPPKLLAHILEIFRQRLAGSTAPLTAWRSLTSREREIVEQVQRGLSNQEIAVQLGISAKTVKAHLHVIFRKLRLRRRYELLRVSFHS